MRIRSSRCCSCSSRRWHFTAQQHEEKTEFDVELTEAGPNKVKVIKVVSGEVTWLRPEGSLKDVVDGAFQTYKGS